MIEKINFCVEIIIIEPLVFYWEVEMTLNQNSLIAIAVVFSLTLIGVIGLTRNTDTEIDIRLGEDKSVNIRGTRSH